MKERILFALTILVTHAYLALAFGVVFLAVVIILTGCTPPEDPHSPEFNAPGLVVDRAKRSVTVRQDDGRTVQHRTSKAHSRRCRAGERWPTC